MTEFKSWFRDNSTLVYFLIAQAFALIGGGAWALSYMTTLENRVATMETRGSPHLSEINTRLTVLEGQTKDNKDSLERIKDVMTRKLNINP